MAFIKIKPTDPLFFRSGKPFNMGEDTWTDSTFLPNPSVVWGAIFSALMTENEKLRNNILNGKEKEPEKYLSINNIYLFNEESKTLLLPAPLDLYLDDDDNVICSKFVDKKNNDGFTDNELSSEVINSSSTECFMLPDSDKNCKRIENRFIDVHCLGQIYYKKQAESISVYPFDEIFETASKIGIKRDSNKHNSEDSNLYRIDLTQFKEDWTFLVDVQFKNTVELKGKGILKLGGEGKTAYYEVIEKSLNVTPYENYNNYIEKKTKPQFCKILLTSPTLLPEDWENLDIKASSIGKPISVGGWDMANHCPKVMKKYAPAGSVLIVTQNGLQNFKKNVKPDIKGFNQYLKLPV